MFLSDAACITEVTPPILTGRSKETQILSTDSIINNFDINVM